MLLPNKLFSYNQSILSKLPAFMQCLDTPQTPKILYQYMSNTLNNPIEFMEILDCLYALCMIDIDDEERIYKC